MGFVFIFTGEYLTIKEFFMKKNLIAVTVLVTSVFGVASAIAVD